MAEISLINNLKGILYYLDIPLLDFEVKNRELIKAVDLNKGKLFPPELAVWGISYGNLNAFFWTAHDERRLYVLPGASESDRDGTLRF